MDYTNLKNTDPAYSLPDTQARVVQNAYKDVDETRYRKNRKASDKYILPYGEKGVSKNVAECVISEIAYSKKIKPKASSNTDSSVYKRDRNNRKHKRDYYPSVLSALNGIVIPTTTTMEDPDAFWTKSEEERRQLVRDQIQLRGLVGTTNEIDTPHGEMGLPYFPIIIGGVQNMYNTSDEVIEACDVVVVDVPVPEKNYTNTRKQIENVSEDKVLLETRPLRADMILTISKLMNEIRGLNDIATNNKLDALYGKDSEWAKIGLGPNQLSNKLIYILKKLAEDRKELNSRVLGTALHSARPGQPFDIMIGRGYCI